MHKKDIIRYISDTFTAEESAFSHSPGYIVSKVMEVYGVSEGDAEECLTEALDAILSSKTIEPRNNFNSVEAVQIEWISNGILVRGKGADGAFCNYYRDTSAFVSQHLNGKTFDFVKGKEPKTGDKCVIYFGIADADSE